MKRIVISLVMMLVVGQCFGLDVFNPGYQPQNIDLKPADNHQPLVQEILPADQIFNLSAQVNDENDLLLHWELPDDIYLYEQQFAFEVTEGGVLGEPEMPQGVLKHDQIFGEQWVHYSPVTIKIPILEKDSDQMHVNISYQGCSNNGYCYPPMTQAATLVFANTSQNTAVTLHDSGHGKSVSQSSLELSRADQITSFLFEQNFAFIILAFLGFGVLLTFTPCVLPMIPILGGIIFGTGNQLSKYKAFNLALIYVVSMAITYAIIGVLAGLAGGSLHIIFQKAWVIVLLSGVFVLLALSMFGLYELRLPVALETRLNNLSQRQRGGTFIGVAIMGILSALIVSPCVTVPLVGALAYIGQTGDAVLGGVALLSLGIGMGIPLLIAATLGAKYLPKSGAWMNVVKAIFGVLLLAVAIWLLERVLAGPIILALWSALFILSAVYLGALEPAQANGLERLWKGVGLVLFVYGLMLLVGAGLGNSNPFKPLSGMEWMYQTGTMPQQSNHIPFKPIKSTEDLNQELMLATQQNRPIMVEFYADWCSACIVMQRTTFADPSVIAFVSQNFIPLQADVTANDVLDRALQRNFSIFAPPAILFFDSNGAEIKSARIVGEIGPSAFLAHIKNIIS